jgi:hypothetical protein
MLFKDLAALRISVRVRASANRLHCTGPRRSFGRIAEHLSAPQLFDQANRIASLKAQP